MLWPMVRHYSTHSPRVSGVAPAQCPIKRTGMPEEFNTLWLLPPLLLQLLLLPANNTGNDAEHRCKFRTVTCHCFQALKP